MRGWRCSPSKPPHFHEAADTYDTPLACFTTATNDWHTEWLFNP